MGIVRENNKYILDIKKAEKVSGHCPSVDYLFESVAIHAKNNSIATILTGMGNDGAKGLLSIKNAGDTQSVKIKKHALFMVCLW